MEEVEKKPKPNLLWSVLTMRCPRCRRGDMFKISNAYKKLSLSHIFGMYDNCPVCKQKFDLEPGFWYGTGYVSYGLLVVFSAISFAAWWLLIGISTNDDRVIYWLIFNAVLIVILQPWIMRLSRVMYIYIFVKYNEHFENDDITHFDH